MAGEGTGEKQAKKPQKLLTNGVSPSVGKATQFKKGQSGNPAGKPKGTISLSTRIQALMNDEEFSLWLPDRSEGWKEFKGAPAEAIIRAAILRAAQGDMKSAEWLAKYGWGNKIELTGEDGAPLMPIALDAAILNRFTPSVEVSPQGPAINSGK